MGSIYQNMSGKRKIVITEPHLRNWRQQHCNPCINVKSGVTCKNSLHLNCSCHSCQ
uniref:Uncharacterized protein MANES_S058800 n=1 Tax=Rhizophora mucronata TaxID=61149 RepID=A0A2P2MKA1_RHIMU